MGNTLIAFRDWVSKAGTPKISISLNFGTEIIDLNNLKSPSLAKITRIQPAFVSNTNIASITVNHSNSERTNDYDGKQGLSVGIIGLLNHNLKIDKSTRFKIFIKQFDGSNTVVAAGFFDHESVYFFNPRHQSKNTYFILSQKYENVESVIFQILDEDKPIDIGRLWISDYFDTEVDAGWSTSLSSQGGRIESIGGSATLSKKPRFVEGSMEFTMLPEEKAYGALYTFEDLRYTVAEDEDLVIIRDSDELQKTAIYGTLTSDVSIAHQNGPFYQTKLDIKQLI